MADGATSFIRRTVTATTTRRRPGDAGCDNGPGCRRRPRSPRDPQVSMSTATTSPGRQRLPGAGPVPAEQLDNDPQEQTPARALPASCASPAWNRNSSTAALRTSVVAGGNLRSAQTGGCRGSRTSGDSRRPLDDFGHVVDLDGVADATQVFATEACGTAGTTRWCRCWPAPGVLPTTSPPPGPRRMWRPRDIRAAAPLLAAPPGSPDSVPAAQPRCRRPNPPASRCAAMSSPMVAASTSASLPWAPRGGAAPRSRARLPAAGDGPAATWSPTPMAFAQRHGTRGIARGDRGDDGGVVACTMVDRLDGLARGVRPRSSGHTEWSAASGHR